jgi:hypothetical protein
MLALSVVLDMQVTSLSAVGNISVCRPPLAWVLDGVQAGLELSKEPVYRAATIFPSHQKAPGSGSLSSPVLTFVFACWLMELTSFPAPVGYVCLGSLISQGSVSLVLWALPVLGGYSAMTACILSRLHPTSSPHPAHPEASHPCKDVKPPPWPAWC